MNKKIIILILIVVIVITTIAVIFLTQKDKTPQIEDDPDQPEVITSDVDTSDWKIYSNEDLGFEFKYPEIFTLFSDHKSVTLEKNCEEKSFNFTDKMKCNFEEKFIIELYDREMEDFIYEYRNDFVNNEPLTKVVLKGSLTLDNILGYKLKGTTAEGSGGLDYIFIKSPHKTYLISYNELVGDYVEILSTFKFIDNIIISELQTYRNEDLGFSFEYPGDWGEAELLRGTQIRVYPNPQNLGNHKILMNINNDREEFQYVKTENIQEMVSIWRTPSGCSTSLAKNILLKNDKFLNASISDPQEWLSQEECLELFESFPKERVITFAPPNAGGAQSVLLKEHEIPKKMINDYRLFKKIIDLFIVF